jgi:hypothetical protein
MITPKEYLMGRDAQYPLTHEQYSMMCDLLARVNYLFGRLNISAKVTSGYRPEKINVLAGGSKNSMHVKCGAIDVADGYGKIGQLLLSRPEMLIEYGLWLESPSYTRKNVDGKTVHWVHLDIKHRENRVFIP